MSKSIVDYKDNIALRLISDKSLCELVLNEAITSIDDADIQERVQDYIQDYLFVPYTKTQESTFINFEIKEDFNGESNVHKRVTLYINALTHYNLMKIKPKFTGTMPTEYLKGNRIDHLSILIANIFTDNYDFGVGKMKLVKNDPGKFNEIYYGRAMVFQVPDLGYKHGQ